MKKILLLIACSVFTVNTFAQSRTLVNITCDGGDAQTQTIFIKKMFDAIGPNREFVPSLGAQAPLQLQARIASMAGRQYVIGELHETVTVNVVKGNYLVKSTNSYFFKAADELDEICDKMADELIGKKDEDKYPTEIANSESVAEVVSKADKKSRKGDGAEQSNDGTQKIKSPWASTGLSFLFPGLGQFYNGQTVKGVLFVLGGVAGIAVTTATDGELALYGVPWIWSMIDGYRSANKINRTYLSWNIGEESVLSIQPDIKYISAFGTNNKEPTYGMSLRIKF